MFPGQGISDTISLILLQRRRGAERQLLPDLHQSLPSSFWVLLAVLRHGQEPYNSNSSLDLYFT